MSGHLPSFYVGIKSTTQNLNKLIQSSYPQSKYIQHSPVSPVCQKSRFCSELRSLVRLVLLPLHNWCTDRFDKSRLESPFWNQETNMNGFAQTNLPLAISAALANLNSAAPHRAAQADGLKGFQSTLLVHWEVCHKYQKCLLTCCSRREFLSWISVHFVHFVHFVHSFAMLRCCAHRSLAEHSRIVEPIVWKPIVWKHALLACLQEVGLIVNRRRYSFPRYFQCDLRNPVTRPFGNALFHSQLHGRLAKQD